MTFPMHIRIFFSLYRLLWFFITPILLCAPRLREGAAERTLKEVKFSKADIWLHAASVGEAYIAGDIVRELGKVGKFDILLTTNTRQGKEIIAKNCMDYGHRIQVAYMVFDNPALVKKAVAIADPKLLVLIELELWPALMARMKQQGKKLMIVNGRMTEKSLRGYQKALFLWKAVAPDVILAISKADGDRLRTIFPETPTRYVSNIKFDRVKRCDITVKETGKEKILVLASIRREEEAAVLFLMVELLSIFPNLHIDLFPRHLHRVPQWQKLLAERDISFVLKTSSPEETSCSVTIWDVFGELLPAYQRADSVFVGGSLAPLGGQNFMEAFMNGVIPVVGPSISNFLWLGEEVFREGLVKKGADSKEVLQLLVDSLNTPVDKKIIRQKANDFIRSKQGGSRKTCDAIVKLLNSES